jgi:hypothetical protein
MLLLSTGGTSVACRAGRFLSSARHRTSSVFAVMTKSTSSTHGADDDVAVAHYTSHHDTDSYEDAYFYEPGLYAENLRDKVQSALGLTRSSLVPAAATIAVTTESGATSAASAPRGGRILLDVGGGTGNFTQMLLRGTTNLRAVVVDPFLVDDDNDDEPTVPSSGASAAPPQLRFVKAGAEAFIRDRDSPTTDDRFWWQSGYHQVLMKEVIHHIKADERVSVFRGLLDGMKELVDATPGGDSMSASATDALSTALPPSLLIVTRPQTDIDYPLWNAARRVWASHQPALEAIVQDLEAAGFVDVAGSVHSHPCAIALSRWGHMVRNRFWSTFSHFSDAELDEGIREMEATERHRLDKEGVLHFEDRLLFISAHNPSQPMVDRSQCENKPF